MTEVHNSATISIYDEIGAWGVSASDFISDLKSLGDVSDLEIHINSAGGNVFDGMAIYNNLKSHKAQKTVYVDGLAASMASVIAMAGDLIVMPENSMMMIHNPWTMAAGDAEELRKNADLLDQVKKSLITAYRRSGKSDQEISDIMDAETWYTGSEAVEQGFADETTEAVAIAASFDLSKFGNVPESAAAVAVKPKAKESEKMTIKNEPTATAPVADVNELRAQLIAENQKRVDGINALFDKFPAEQELAMKCVMDQKCSIEDAQKRLLDQLGKKAEPVGGQPVTCEDTGRKAFIEDAVEAIIGRAGKGEVKSTNQLRGYTARELARLCAERAGIKTQGMDPHQFIAAAFTGRDPKSGIYAGINQSTSDFPVLLENTMHKVLQGAYAAQPDTWSRFCATGSVVDFRAHNRYRLGSIGNLDALLENGEFKNKAIPDGEKQSITASTKGNVINLTRQTIINDDLGAFITLSAMLGRAAARTIEADVYTTLALNSGLGPLLSDGVSLFHANHGNISTGAALSAAAIDADRVTMASQTDISGNDYLDLRPQVLLVPISLGSDARTINDAQYDPDTANKLQKPNAVRGLFADIVDTPRLSGTRRYLFADPNIAPVLEVAFLNGERAPFLDSQDGFTIDGVQWKVRLDFGIAGVGSEGAVTNAGA